MTGFSFATLAWGLAALTLVVVAIWGETVRRLVRHVERAHPDWFETLRGRSRKSGRRLAVSSALQTALSRGEVPDAVRSDPAAAHLLRREAALRGVLWPLVLAAFVAFALS